MAQANSKDTTLEKKFESLSEGRRIVDDKSGALIIINPNVEASKFPPLAKINAMTQQDQ